ncbi:KAT8 regulatory NSL complex subunit 2-like [Argiope bruennichi]|uniref:KAT8 regulatory NSL complex subunit 2 n=1 Tax=Argiope bruennichi TaxID=94029 RepID=A0A8T0E3B3_ARGBR|nr:KAT8 regulatory NSL complex subunit 2-like [Argiope bruennichi]KAF8764687.1 KAT8 regulatory NSL complex subunit 2 like protein [Argiope bruennichi]
MPNFTKGNPSSEPERFCKYIHRYCNQTRLEGYDYCIRHILEDKLAPFRQCTYVNQPNKKKCTNAAPKMDKHERRDALCPFHTKRALMKTKISHQPKKKVVVEGPTALLRYLEHYCSDPVHDPTYSREIGLNEKNEMAVCVGERPTTLSQAEASFVDGESVEEKAHIESVDDDFCWVEKPGDYLEHAGVYTEKEVLKIAKEKIIRLQELYCTELNVIYHELKEKRRRFLADMRKSTATENAVEEPDTPVQIDEKTLKALTQYHKCEGMERILRDKSQTINSDTFRAAKGTICSFERNDVKCTEPAIVLTKFCKNHILSDPNQVMFRPCGLGRNCKRPVIPYEEKAACDQHFHLALSRPKADETAQTPPVSVIPFTETEPFQSMDDIASLGLDDIIPGSLFGLDQFGEPGESTDTVLSEDLMQIPLNPPENILSDSRKSESE